MAPLTPDPMAPKAAAPKKRLGKKATVGTDASQQKKSAAAPKVKKAKTEPISHDELNGNNTIPRKKGRDKMLHTMKYMDKNGNPNPLAVYKHLKSRTDKENFYNKYLRTKSSSG